MKVGFNKINITPKTSCYMAGYSRTKKSDGVHDPIEINTFSITVENQTYVTSILDSIVVEEKFCNHVKDSISLQCEIPIENISISCIHTHSAPSYFKLTFEDNIIEEELVSQVSNSMIESIKSSIQCQKECTIDIEKSYINGIYGNRNNKNGFSDKSCSLIHFYDKSNNPLGILFNISLHPTFFSRDNYLLSADIIGLTRNKLEQEFNCPVVATNGACGDVSTRYYRSELDDIDSTVNKLFEMIMNTREKAPYINGMSKRFQGSLEAKFDAHTDEHWSTINNELEKSRTPANSQMVDAFLYRQQLKKTMSPIILNLIYQIMVIGNIIIVYLPGDVVSSLGAIIKNTFTSHTVILVCYSNTYCNYLVSKDEYGKYFETHNSRLAYGVADSLIFEVIKKINQMI
ncbi:MAG: neutral/alkaline non-lysosomal ceramidase N-terminal domain-containing protein [Anaerorhabdus sp.]